MKILWITNLPLPEAHDYLFHAIQAKEGWLVHLSQMLRKQTDVELYVASRTLLLEKERDFTIGGVHHYCFPSSYANNEHYLNDYWHRIYNEINPDVVHIHGTECTHSASFVKTCPQANIVVSIQGLVSMIARYYYGGVSEHDLAKYTTLYNWYKNNTIRNSYRNMVEMGEREKYILSHVKYAIGRTEWDRIHVMNINPDIQYFLGNETMRPLFYSNRWSIERCTPKSIFVTQGNEPYKGLHQLLKAVAIIKNSIPNVKLTIAIAPNLTMPMSWKTRIQTKEYPLYIRDLLFSLGLERNVHVYGPLSEEGMVKAMLDCNVFVSPSAIENSPNSLCEAQLLGVPSVASYVGGTPTITDNGLATEMYRYEEIEMLAAKIVHIFKSGVDIKRIEYARNLALKRHNPDNNVKSLIDIYHTIINK